MSESGPGLDELQCTCCGDVAAVADDDGEFTDGQPAMCGCSAYVVVEEDAAPEVQVDPDGCSRCRLYREERWGYLGDGEDVPE